MFYPLTNLAYDGSNVDGGLPLCVLNVHGGPTRLAWQGVELGGAGIWVVPRSTWAYVLARMSHAHPWRFVDGVDEAVGFILLAAISWFFFWLEGCSFTSHYSLRLILASSNHVCPPILVIGEVDDTITCDHRWWDLEVTKERVEPTPLVTSDCFAVMARCCRELSEASGFPVAAAARKCNARQEIL